jgi:hypothetical protein
VNSFVVAGYVICLGSLAAYATSLVLRLRTARRRERTLEAVDRARRERE